MKGPFRMPKNMPARILRARKLSAIVEIVAFALILMIEGQLAWDSVLALSAFYSVLGILVLVMIYRHTLRMHQAIYK